METSVIVLQDELEAAMVGRAAILLESDEQAEDYINDLREGIMTLNKVLFHRKIMGADPRNEFYNAKD